MRSLHPSAVTRCKLALFGGFLPTHSHAADFHVARTGRDLNAGTAVRPFATLSAARGAARKFAGKESVTIRVADGIYHLPETLVLTPQDSGTTQHPVTWRAVNEGKAVITGKNPDGSLACEGGWQNNRQMGMHKEFRMVENVFEELDAPGERFHNAKTNTLSFVPLVGMELKTATVEVVELPHLVERCDIFDTVLETHDHGSFKMDLAAVKEVHAITAWSFNQNGNRGRQIVTLCGSKSATDPGWNVGDASRLAPLGCIDTAPLGDAALTASSLRAPHGRNLGDFRWIVRQTNAATGIVENTVWQEFFIETSH